MPRRALLSLGLLTLLALHWRHLCASTSRLGCCCSGKTSDDVRELRGSQVVGVGAVGFDAPVARVECSRIGAATEGVGLPDLGLRISSLGVAALGERCL